MPPGHAFFERLAIALERKALPLECHAQRIEMLERQRAEFRLKALVDLLACQRLGRGHAHDCGDHLIAQRARPPAFMADLDQPPDHALFAPCVCPVVDRLAAHAELRAHRHRAQLATREHQQSGRPRSHILVGMVDRQLRQGLLLSFSQYYDALYSALQRMVTPKLTNFNPFTSNP